MKLPIYTSTTVPRGSGLARAQDIGALTASSDRYLYSGIGAFGRGLNVASDYAFRQTQERHDIDARLQYSKITSDYESFISNLARQIQNAPVETDMQRQVMHENLMDEVDKYRQKKLKTLDNKDAIDDENIIWPKLKLRYDDALWSMLSRNLDRYQIKTGEDAGLALIKAGRLEEAQKHFNQLQSKGLFTEEQVKNIMDYGVTDTEARRIMFEKGYDEARQYVMGRDIGTDIKRKIVSDIAFEASQLKIERDNQLEQKETEYLFKLRQNALTDTQVQSDLVTGIIDSDLAKEYFRYIDAQAEEILKGEKIQTNQIIKGELETMAYGIHDGSVTMPEFLKRLKEERYDKKTIDDSAYDSLLTTAQGKYESYQAKAMNDRFNHAKGQLLTYASELDVFAAIQKMAKEEAEVTLSERQLQLDNWDRYKRALNGWFENQREQKNYPTATEIYEEGRRLLIHYRKTSEQLRDEEANRVLDEQAREKLRTATQAYGKEELKKAKQLLSEKYSNQLEYLTITFNLNEAEKQKAKELLDSGVTLDELVKYLQKNEQ